MVMTLTASASPSVYVNGCHQSFSKQVAQKHLPPTLTLVCSAEDHINEMNDIISSSL